MKDKIAITSIYRVQGGTFPSRSRKTIVVNEDNLIECSRTKNIYIGDQEHMRYFLYKRLGIKDSNDLKKRNIDNDVHVIEMKVPYWLPYLINTYAVKQFRSKDTSYPKLVDRSIPGQSYQISKDWSELLKASCIYAQDYKIETKEDIINLLLQQEINKKRNLDYKYISKIIHKCKVDQADIDTLREVWGVGTVEKGER